MAFEEMDDQQVTQHFVNDQSLYPAPIAFKFPEGNNQSFPKSLYKVDLTKINLEVLEKVSKTAEGKISWPLVIEMRAAVQIQSKEEAYSQITYCVF